MGLLSRERVAIVSLVCASILLSPFGVRGGEAVEEYRLKGAFLYNFAKFVSWPSELTEGLAALRICVNGPRATQNALKASLDGKVVVGLPIEVRAIGANASAKGCQLVFASRDAGVNARQLARAVSGRPVLLVGESKGFARGGGMIGFVEENAKLRFEVNLAAVERAGLRVSSHLLKLARVVVNPL